MHAIGGTPDVREGVESFLEKRQARFTGTVPADLPDFYPWWPERPFNPISGTSDAEIDEQETSASPWCRLDVARSQGREFALHPVGQDLQSCDGRFDETGSGQSVQDNGGTDEVTDPLRTVGGLREGPPPSGRSSSVPTF